MCLQQAYCRGVAKKDESEQLLIAESGHEVKISNPNKVLFPEIGETKLDLVRYYQSVRSALMRAIGGRPVMLQRFPNGATGSSFFQKRVPESHPNGCRQRSSPRRTAPTPRRSSFTIWPTCYGR